MNLLRTPRARAILTSVPAALVTTLLLLRAIAALITDLLLTWRPRNLRAVAAAGLVAALTAIAAITTAPAVLGSPQAAALVIARHPAVLRHSAASAVSAASDLRFARELADHGQHMAAPVPPYTVQPGDTLTGIAARLCGTTADAGGLYAANRQVIGPDPNVIIAGKVLHVSCRNVPWTAGPVDPPAGPAIQGTYTGTTALQQCIIAHESSGNIDAWSPSGLYWGLYQFAYGTWTANGGPAGDWGKPAISAAEQTRIFWVTVHADGYGPWAGDGCVAVTTAAVTADGPAVTGGTSAGARALAWAEENAAGVPYAWGGTGDGGYDCSGLVMTAYAHAGVTLPRDTYEMLATAGTLLIPVSDPQPGDLAFFGSGHVELYVRPGVTFGAQQPGTVVGFHTYDAAYGYAPTAFYRVS